MSTKTGHATIDNPSFLGPQTDLENQLLTVSGKPGCLSKAYSWVVAKGREYPKTRTFLVTLLALGILAAVASLGIHYGMTDGFAGLHHKIMALEYGTYIGMGAGAGGILVGGGLIIGIHKLLKKWDRDDNEVEKTFRDETPEEIQ